MSSLFDSPGGGFSPRRMNEPYDTNKSYLQKRAVKGPLSKRGRQDVSYDGVTDEIGGKQGRQSSFARFLRPITLPLLFFLADTGSPAS